MNINIEDFGFYPNPKDLSPDIMYIDWYKENMEECVRTLVPATDFSSYVEENHVDMYKAYQAAYWGETCEEFAFDYAQLSSSDNNVVAEFVQDQLKKAS